jgi:hypothetical protein
VQQSTKPLPAGRDERAAAEWARAEAAIDRRVTVDADTQELVFRAISEESGEVLRQVPDQAMLRIRAYTRELRETEAEHASERHVARIV